MHVLSIVIHKKGKICCLILFYLTFFYKHLLYHVTYDQNDPYLCCDDFCHITKACCVIKAHGPDVFGKLMPLRISYTDTVLNVLITVHVCSFHV